jgi:hypothetical protein
MLTHHAKQMVLHFALKIAETMMLHRKGHEGACYAMVCRQKHGRTEE